MMVNEIIELTKGRRKIVTDNGQSFCLYVGEISKLHIKAGEELQEAEYQKIMTEILPKRAKLRGLNLLAKRPYTEYQLRQKYIDGGYPEAIIEAAIQYIKDVHCLDDYAYCVSYFTYKSNQKSKRQIVNDLRLKGVSQDIIESAYNEVYNNGDMTDENELIERLMKKRHFDRETATFEEKQKLMNYLYNKGFSMDSIRSGIR